MTIVPEVEWLKRWLASHLELRPAGSVSLTYFCAKFAVYREYMLQSRGENIRPLTQREFDKLLLSELGLRLSRCRGFEIIDGARFYVDRIGGNLCYGM